MCAKIVYDRIKLVQSQISMLLLKVCRFQKNVECSCAAGVGVVGGSGFCILATTPHPISSLQLMPSFYIRAKV